MVDRSLTTQMGDLKNVMSNSHHRTVPIPSPYELTGVGEGRARQLLQIALTAPGCVI